MKQDELLSGSGARNILTVFFAAVCLLCSSCGTSHEAKTGQHYPAASSPGTCKIKGEIVSIIKTLEKDTGSICSHYYCKALVSVTDNYGCGSSAVYSINPGDTIAATFTVSLANTSKAFPQMRVHYPGLKKGSVFVADVVQHPAVGSGAEFIIDGYEVIEKR